MRITSWKSVFRHTIDFSTLKHLVTDVPDPPMAIIEPSRSVQQPNVCVSSRTIKHLIVDVPDPPPNLGSACRIQEGLPNLESGWSSSVNCFLNYSYFARCRKAIYRFSAFVDRCVHEELRRKNTRAEKKSNVLTSQKTTTPWDKRSIVLLCLSFLVPISNCDDHVLSYYHTGLYYPMEGRYWFETVGYVDDQQIDMYSSESRVNIPKALWMEENESNDYWERQTSLRKGWEKVFKDNLMILASRFNYTRRLHTLQLSYGCELHNDDSITGRYQYGFDGKDFLLFDINTLLWNPGMQKAEISAQRWNSDRGIGEGVKSYITEHCTSALKKYTGYGRQDLEKRVVPKVKIHYSKSQDGTTRLHCLVYGFHPRAVHVKWVRNGADDVPSDEMSPILPHPDGTYQIRVSAEVPVKEGDTYSCNVDHSSLEETLSVKWEPNVDLPLGGIVGGCVGAIVVIAVIIGVYVYRKKKQGYSSTNTSDIGSSMELPNTPRA